MIYKIECLDCEQEYTQENQKGDCKPIRCGACASLKIRLWEMIYDNYSHYVKERLNFTSTQHEMNSIHGARNCGGE